MQAVLITPEIQRADDRAREAMAEAMQPLELGRSMAGYGGRIEIGAWTEATIE
jgi:hypothetical protein